ncbi:hypothetical protein J5J10_09705 [Ciceribacter sp. L1K23]|nr:hypothetical protein [Ciceribacter sp. L1K22]MBR0555951.1 hypothetical protein [Ciceribacter sp. L1K23]
MAVTLLGLLLAFATPALANDIDRLPVTVTFLISGGFWEEDAETLADNPALSLPSTTEGQETDRLRGYYKLVSVRQSDRTAKIYLQQIASTDAGPHLLQSVELEEFSAIKPYVTDIRPEDSTGMTLQPGFFATVYLKTDPAATEPESWTVLIDEFGEIRVERATN